MSKIPLNIELIEGKPDLSADHWEDSDVILIYRNHNNITFPTIAYISHDGESWSLISTQNITIDENEIAAYAEIPYTINKHSFIIDKSIV